jgi:hypothetical protein
MEKLQEAIKKEGEKLAGLLKQAGYTMINFDIEKNAPEHGGLSIHIWARSED